jgi:hypothetical protein
MFSLTGQDHAVFVSQEEVVSSLSLGYFGKYQTCELKKVESTGACLLRACGVA